MEQKVYDTIVDNNLIKSGDKLVVGVSGGPDSMALLCVLKNIQKSINFTIISVHINHGIRGKEADKDEKYVKNICKQWNIPFYNKKVNMDEYAKINKMSSEEAGRELRYKFFNEILKKESANKIAVAHNKNDQAETVMMRFLRGTGIEGLKGMEFKVGNIIRPLLSIDRSLIEEYCEDNNLNPRIDKTNLQPIYGRNKIRLELIPYIENNFNKGIVNTLTRTANIMNEDNDFINKYAEEKFEKVCNKKSKNIIEIKVEEFKELHISIKSRIIRLSIEAINGNRKNIGLKHIKIITHFIENGVAGKTHDTTMGVELLKKYDTCLIRKKENSLHKVIKDRNKLVLNAKNYNNNFKSDIIIEIKDIQKIDFKSNDRFIKYIDYDKIKGDLYIRNRKPGDKFVPFGMKGSKKLKDYFIDNKIPREERDNIPIIEDEKNIIWVVGYRLSDLYKVDKNTKKVILIQYITKEDLYDKGH
ncbi:tRNA lysidine(34) synthetase TilS [Abyssisolibacter fermentans]|uniref:tRNA lysidine(34) synthetase TilS n=1 Tax=Abyssisolibacter fermentans TaxID=1766203 RepID=UPI00083493B8|nr:tRNA lysidine(34) synthetase TilS [Abyssisolibacter fermentans]